MNDNPNIPVVRGFTTPAGRMYMMNENDTIQALEAENTLMNELVSDQKREIEKLQAKLDLVLKFVPVEDGVFCFPDGETADAGSSARAYREQDERLRSIIKDRDKTIESLRGEVNRLSRALVDRGVPPTQVRNIASG